jgi:putative Mn2+ efflux pump MntP
VLSLLLVAASLGASNLAAAIGIGLGGINQRARLRVAIVFGLFELTMPLIGLAVGRAAATGLGNAAHHLGGGLLVAIGLYQAITSLGRRPDATMPSPNQTGRLVLSGLALSIDNLVVGFALGALDVNFLVAALTISAVSVAMSLVGLELGSRLGTTIEHDSATAGGVVLIAVGIALAAGII